MMKFLNDFFVAAYIILAVPFVLFGFGAAGINIVVAEMEERCLMPYTQNYPRCRRND